MRADQLLVAQGLAPSRSAAQRLIGCGAVERRTPQGWAALRKAGEELTDDAPLRITDDAETRWVSRGGLKLDAALIRTGVAVEGRVCLDAGQSTGGFTEVLLSRGAARVIGFDVGHGQLRPRLRSDARVRAFEGLHVRQLVGSALSDEAPAAGFDVLVADLSFISLAASIVHLAPWLAPHGQALLLVKPQFEVGPEHVGKGGVVKDERQYLRVETALRGACRASGWQVLDYFASAVNGGDGNREFFVWAAPMSRPLEVNG
ncbi:TlyA family RNA methyltransferase [Methylibium sp.]|uniref:TlyA family RNA methyltransferase n=1 Tax=Methylibium sp. TaxID=2067992 RepID=UPI00182E751E|nr:TlyA family RNA methyltransferase [Methylibium sp.]MBA3589171.1 TlyA family RNA methyltransferase [Methylibium sp.]